MKYGDEYLIWRDVFINGLTAADAIEANQARSANPDNQQARAKAPEPEAKAPAAKGEGKKEAKKDDKKAAKATVVKSASASNTHQEQEGVVKSNAVAVDERTANFEPYVLEETVGKVLIPSKDIDDGRKALIGATANADKFFKFHTKYGPKDLMISALGTLIFALVVLLIMGSY